MINRRLRVLFLNTAFPPGVTGRFPSLYPTGHSSDTRMALALAKLTDLDSVGLLNGEVFGRLEPRDDSFGIEHGLILWDRKPELWHRWRSWRRLRDYYLEQVSAHGMPDVVLVRGLGPVFNHFARWLRGRRPRPLVVLVFGESSTFGGLNALRRLRYWFKPMVTPNDRAIFFYDASILASVSLRPFFEKHKIPCLWSPQAFNFPYEPPPPDPAQTGPIRFGYFGALAEHTAIVPAVKYFLEAQVPGSLHVCGFGKLSDELKQLALRHPNFQFDGLLPKQSDCLAWAQKVDVLINPRLPIWGLENSFPSKILEFAMTGKAILSTRTGGVDEVLGENGLYLETEDFGASFKQRLREISLLDRAELQRRGTAIRRHVLQNFNWEEQSRRMVDFMAETARATAAQRTAEK